MKNQFDTCAKLWSNLSFPTVFTVRIIKFPFVEVPFLYVSNTHNFVPFFGCSSGGTINP